MCIIFTNITERPSDEILIRAQRRNDDGIGFAWRENGLVRWEKHIKIEHLLDRLHTNPPAFPNVIHFRIATQGGERPELCHPFAVTPQASVALAGQSRAVLFHNGNWTGWESEVKQAILVNKTRVPQGPWSDSRAMALLAGIYGPNIFNLLNMTGQRICYFANNELLTWGQWHQQGGWFASNPTFQNTSCSLNIQDDREWGKSAVAYDPKAGKLVPVARIPSSFGPELEITVISEGSVVKERKAESTPIRPILTATKTGSEESLELEEIGNMLMKLRIYCKRLGYVTVLGA